MPAASSRWIQSADLGASNRCLWSLPQRPSTPPPMWALVGLVGTALALQAAFGSQVVTVTL